MTVNDKGMTKLKFNKVVDMLFPHDEDKEQLISQGATGIYAYEEEEPYEGFTHSIYIQYDNKPELELYEHHEIHENTVEETKVTIWSELWEKIIHHIARRTVSEN